MVVFFPPFTPPPCFLLIFMYYPVQWTPLFHCLLWVYYSDMCSCAMYVLVERCTLCAGLAWQRCSLRGHRGRGCYLRRPSIPALDQSSTVFGVGLPCRWEWEWAAVCHCVARCRDVYPRLRSSLTDTHARSVVGAGSAGRQGAADAQGAHWQGGIGTHLHRADF